MLFAISSSIRRRRVAQSRILTALREREREREREGNEENKNIKIFCRKTARDLLFYPTDTYRYNII